MSKAVSTKTIKRGVEILCGIPVCLILYQAFFLTPSEFPFWNRSLFISGFSAVIFLVICLSVSPLAEAFSRVQFLKLLCRYKREWGLSSFFYVLLHITSYLIKKTLKNGGIPWEVFLDPEVLAGEIAFLLLIPLAWTSNNAAIRKMGWAKWKRLHRLVYAVEAAIFLHILFIREDSMKWALIIFIPLFLVQSLRLKKRI